MLRISKEGFKGLTSGKRFQHSALLRETDDSKMAEEVVLFLNLAQWRGTKKGTHAWATFRGILLCTLFGRLRETSEILQENITTRTNEAHPRPSRLSFLSKSYLPANELGEEAPNATMRNCVVLQQELTFSAENHRGVPVGEIRE